MRLEKKMQKTKKGFRRLNVDSVSQPAASRPLLVAQGVSRGTAKENDEQSEINFFKKRQIFLECFQT